MKKRETNLPLSKHSFLHELPYTNCWTSIKKNFQHCKLSTVTFLLLRHGALDAHAVERAVDEGEGNGEEGRGEDVCQSAALRGGQSHGEFDGEKAEERCEFNDRIEGDGRRVFKRIADGVADDGGVVKRRAFLFEFHFHKKARRFTTPPSSATPSAMTVAS